MSAHWLLLFHLILTISKPYPKTTHKAIMFSTSISLSTPFLSSKSTPLTPSPLPASIRFQQPPRVSAAYTATAERTASTTSRISTTASLYEVLGIQTSASCHEIKTAYRRLARVLHPDAGKDTSADEFIRIHAAYSTLSDPEKRADYDRNLFRRRRSERKPFAMSSEFSGYARRTWETDQCW